MSTESSKRIARYNIEHITDTAMVMFLKKGINETSIEEIARCGNMSRVTIYKYFKSKTEIGLAVFERYIFQKSLYFRENILAPSYGDLSGFEQISLQINSYAALQKENPGILPFICELTLLTSQNNNSLTGMKLNHPTFEWFSNLYYDALHKGFEDGSIPHKKNFLFEDYLFARQVAESIFFNYYILYGRTFFVDHSQELFRTMQKAVERFADVFCQP